MHAGIPTVTMKRIGRRGFRGWSLFGSGADRAEPSFVGSDRKNFTTKTGSASRRRSQFAEITKNCSGICTS
jgi:hypothetical protein